MTDQEKAVIDAALAYDDAYWAWWNNTSNDEARAMKQIKNDKHDALLDAVLALKNTNR